MSQFKHMKKIASLILVFAMVLLLVSCTNTTKVPNEGITNNKYLTVGDNVTITEMELYEGLRKQSATTLASIIDEYLFKDEIVIANKLLSNDSLSEEDEENLTRAEATEEFDKLVSEFIFGTNDIEQIRKMGDLRRQVAIEGFVDSIYLLDNNTNKNVLFDDINTRVNAVVDALDSEEITANFFEVDTLKENYVIRIAQRIYAIEQLKLDVVNDKEGEDQYFIKDSDLINYYKNNVRNRQDVEAFIFSFRHLAEATAVLRQLSIKVDGAGYWYEIPNIADPLVAAEVIANTDSSYNHVNKILDDLSIEPNENNQYTTKQFNQYYAAYSPSRNRQGADGDADSEMKLKDVIEFFVRAYNIVNINNQIKYEDNSFKYNDDSPFDQLTYTYDDLGKLGSGIRSYVYDSLTADDEDEENKNSYSSLRSSGSRRYLIIKLDDGENEDLIHEDRDEETDEEQWIDTVTEEQKQEFRDEIFKSKLTSDYISKKVNELHEDSELEIFDNVIRSNYEDSYEYNGKDKDKTGKVIASIADRDITARELFTRMEKSYGVNLALDLAVNKVLLDEDYDNLTSDDKKKFESDFRDLMNSFSRDEFEQAGFPASVGRAKFLMSIFGAKDNKEAIELGFVIPKLREDFALDYNSHYNNIYEKLAQLTNLQYDNYKSVNVSHLLVYFDENGDGTPDNPKEYLEALEEKNAGVTENIEKGIVKLMIGSDDETDDFIGIFQELAHEDIADTKGGLNLLANEINDAGRVSLNNNTRSVWTEFAKLGLNVKFEEIGDITNTSNFISGSSTLDPVFYDRAMTLHSMLKDRYDEAKTGLDYLDFNQLNTIKPGKNNSEGKFVDEAILPLTVDDLKLIRSDFGYHFILVNGLGANNSFEYDEADDRNSDYELVLNKDTDEEKTLNPYNNDDKISVDQIEYFIKGSEEDKGAALPNSLEKAFNKHFNPVFSRYNENEHMQRELYFNRLNNLGIKLYDTDGNHIAQDSRFEDIRSINKRQFFDYLTKSGDLEYDENFDTLYGQWFTILES